MSNLGQRIPGTDAVRVRTHAEMMANFDALPSPIRAALAHADYPLDPGTILGELRRGMTTPVMLDLISKTLRVYRERAYTERGL